MRQAGYLAAAGIYALDHNIDRLKEDHQKARAISKVLSTLSYVTDVYPVETNILVFEIDASISTSDFLEKLQSQGILAVAFGPQLIRFVSHLDFSDADVEILADVLKKMY